MEGAVHRRPIIWAALFVLASTLFCADASRAIATGGVDCQHVTQPKIIHGTTPILFVHGINSDHSVWDGNTNVDGTSQNPLTYIQAALGPSQVTGYTFDWSKFSGLPLNGKVSWVADPPPANLGILLAQAITCVASHAGHKVIIIAHSMGGLLIEYASHVTQTASDIAAVFTLGTPYQGSWLASTAIGQGPDKSANDSVHALEALCPYQKSPANKLSHNPSLKSHHRPSSVIDKNIVALCHLLNERNDPGIAAMRLEPPQGGGWKKLPPLPVGLPWYPLAASVQGVWQLASPVRIAEPLNYVGDGVVSPASQLAGGSKPTLVCQVDATIRPRGRPVAQRQPWFLDAVSSPCFHNNEPHNKTLLDHIIGIIRSNHMTPTASISSPTKSPAPPPPLPQHWQQLRTLTDPTSGDIRNIAVSPADDLLATCAFDGSSYLWNMTSGQLIATITQANSADSVHSLAFSPDGKTLALGSGDGIVLRDVTTMGTIGTINWVGNGAVSSLAFSPDGKTLAAADLGGNGAYLWDVASGSQIALLSTSIGAVAAVAFSPDGKTLAVGGDNGTVLWDVAAQHPITTLGTSGSGPIISAAFSPDGKTLATGGFTGAVLWNVATQHKVAVIRNLRMPADSTAVAFSPDGAILATAGTSTPLWAAATGAKIAALPTVSGSVAFSPHGLTLVTTSGHSVILWLPG
jgi:WD40 repeat protein/pimeloyl-ACP methyl ester carboxylesterase